MSADGHAPTPDAAASHDWVIPQGFASYTAQEHRTWLTLYDRQSGLLPGRACDAFLRGLEALDLRGDGIPEFARINETLRRLTGWTVVAVPGLVPDEVFFEHLSNRRFPAGNFIRRPDQLDYIQEPDVFHDVFGHVPMLTDPTFADYMQAYGRGGARAASLGRMTNLARLYWYTVEFGLLQTAAGLRIYGAGIVSSPAETVFSLASDAPRRLAFDLERVMRTPYKIDDFQALYFAVPSLERLRDATMVDFDSIYARLSAGEDMTLDSRAPQDIDLADNLAATAPRVAGG